MTAYQMFINGKCVNAKSGKTFDVFDPATEQVIATCPAGEAPDIAAAAAASKAAFYGGWKATSAQERGRILFKIADRIRARRDELALIETLNSGKPIVESEYRHGRLLAVCFEYYVGLATKINGEVIPVPTNAMVMAVKEPMGVAGQIIPWTGESPSAVPPRVNRGAWLPRAMTAGRGASMRVRGFRGGVVSTGVVVGVFASLIGLASPAQADPVRFSSVPLDRWDSNGKVYATKIVGTTVYIGGSFSQVRSPSGATSTRSNLAALNLTTGDVLSFRADTNVVVRALEGDALTVWVGGAFTTIGGTSRSRLAAVSASSGSVRTAFSANATSTVYALERGGSNLYVGGSFGSIKGVANPRLASVDPASGGVRTGFRPAPNNTVHALVISPKADRLYAGGTFTSIGGVTRSNVSAVNPSTGVASGPTMASASGRGMALDISAAPSGNATKHPDQPPHGWNFHPELSDRFHPDPTASRYR